MGGVPRRSSALLALTLLLAGCADPDPAGDGPRPYRLEPACPPAGAPPLASADLVNQVVARGDLPYWQAGDVGASARLSDGRLVWVFGDTVRSGDVTPRLVANSLLVTSGTCVSQLLPPGNGPVVPDASGGGSDDVSGDVSGDVVRWPMSVVVLPPTEALADAGVDDVVVVLCARTERGDGSGGTLDFRFRGTTAAVFTVRAGQALQPLEVLELTPDDPSEQQVNWGAAATVSGDWYHVYGTRLTGEPFEFGRELYVARIPVADPADRDTWRFWDGTRWQADIGAAAPVLAADGGVSQTLSVDEVDGTWVAVSKRGGDLGDFVWTWTAPGPTGPWTPSRALPAPAGYDTGLLTYAPLAHPEVPLSSGGLLVSVSRNTTDLAQLLDRPEVGRPLFAEIPRP